MSAMAGYSFLSIFRFLYPRKFEESLSSLDSDDFQREEKAFLLSSSGSSWATSPWMRYSNLDSHFVISNAVIFEKIPWAQKKNE